MGKSLRRYGEEPHKLGRRAAEVMGKSIRRYGEEPHKLGEEPQGLWGRVSEVMG